MSAPADGPLAGWSVTGDGTPAVREGVALLAAVGASVGVREAGLALTPPDGASSAVEGLGADAASDWAASGAVWLTGSAAGAPLLPGGAVASRAGGALLAVRLLSRMLGREVSLDGRLLLGERAALAGLRRRGPSSPGGGTRLLPATDGPVAVTLSREDDIAALPALIERDIVGNPWAAVARWVRQRPSGQVADRAALLGIPAAGLGSALGGVAPYQLVSLVGEQRALPADGPLVVDLTSMWAGPLAANLLGLAGCRVVKVELNGRLDGARRGPAAFFDLLHHGQLSVQLDGRDGLSRLRDLLSAADLVLESARPRALRQLSISPALGGGSWVAIRAYDAGGPWAERPGFGDDVAVACGLAVRSGARVLPVGDAIADPVAGACAAVAGLAALVGRGRWQVETSLAQALSGVVSAVEGVPAERAGRGWVVADGVPVARPVARAAVGRAPAPGADNAMLGTLLAC